MLWLEGKSILYKDNELTEEEGMKLVSGECKSQRILIIHRQRYFELVERNKEIRGEHFFAYNASYGYLLSISYRIRDAIAFNAKLFVHQSIHFSHKRLFLIS